MIEGTILFVPTALAIIAFIKKKQKYDEAVKKTKDIENDPTLSWLPISYRNSFAFSYISDWHYLRKNGYPEGSLKRLRDVSEKPSANSKLKSSDFINEYIDFIKKSLIRLLNSLMRDSSLQALRFIY